MSAAFAIDIFFKLLAALPVTLEVWSLSVVIGAFLAMGLTWMRVSGSFVLSTIARAYVFVFRGSPLLIQLFIIYYGLASFAFVRQSFAWPLLRNAFACATLSLALCTAAYSSEIFRGALAGVPPGQIEAARACGMSGFKLFRRIIFPIALRQALDHPIERVGQFADLVVLVDICPGLEVSLAHRPGRAREFQHRLTDAPCQKRATQ